MSKRRRKFTFKPFDSHQMSLLPPSLEELTPQNLVVRIVKSVIGELNIEPILKRYKRWC